VYMANTQEDINKFLSEQLNTYAGFLINKVKPLEKKYGQTPPTNYVIKTYEMLLSKKINNLGADSVLEGYYEANNIKAI